jgi:hypothetical protein
MWINLNIVGVAVISLFSSRATVFMAPKLWRDIGGAGD